MASHPSTVRRFWKYVRKSDDGCWIWIGAIAGQTKHSAGYGSIYNSETGRMLRANRLSYEIHVRELSPSESVCHTCDNSRCVSPDHLFAASHTENMRDAANKGRVRNRNMGKMECDSGHPLVGDNLYIHPSRGTRDCKECRRTRAREWARQQAKEEHNGIS